MLAAIKTGSARELANIPLAAMWPDIERAIVALNDADPRKRSDAGDALVDRIFHVVGDTRARLAACDEFEGNEG